MMEGIVRTAHSRARTKNGFLKLVRVSYLWEALTVASNWIAAGVLAIP
jgi:hypothetical protein